MAIVFMLQGVEFARSRQQVAEPLKMTASRSSNNNHPLSHCQLSTIFQHANDDNDCSEIWTKRQTEDPARF